MNEPNGTKNDRQQYNFNLVMAAVSGQVGCFTILIIFVALFAGIYLDRVYQTKPLFTILLMIGSIPVTVWLMYRIVKSATSKIKPVIKNKNNEFPEGGSES